MPGPPQGVWVCQLLGFRNSPPEGSQSSPGTANEKTGEDRPGEGSAKHTAGASFLRGSDLPKRSGHEMLPQAGRLSSVICSFLKHRAC